MVPKKVFTMLSDGVNDNTEQLASAAVASTFGTFFAPQLLKSLVTFDFAGVAEASHGAIILGMTLAGEDREYANIVADMFQDRLQNFPKYDGSINVPSVGSSSCMPKDHPFWEMPLDYAKCSLDSKVWRDLQPACEWFADTLIGMDWTVPGQSVYPNFIATVKAFPCVDDNCNLNECDKVQKTHFTCKSGDDDDHPSDDDDENSPFSICNIAGFCLSEINSPNKGDQNPYKDSSFQGCLNGYGKIDEDSDNQAYILDPQTITCSASGQPVTMSFDATNVVQKIASGMKQVCALLAHTSSAKVN